MRRNGIVIIVLFCSLLLTQGCATTPSNNQIVGDKIIVCLTACLNKLTKDELIMQASTPTEKAPTADGGEIWIYKYRRSETKTTAEGTGSILMPVVAESKSQDYSLDVMLRFSKEGKLVQGSYRGNAAAFSHPFAALQCQ